MTRKICGVDVAKDRLDAHFPDAHGAFDNTPQGIAQLAKMCRTQAIDLVVMEATGHHHMLCFQELWEAGVACALVNPRCVRRFAEAMGFLEKTDQIDAQVIARFGEVKALHPTPLPSQEARHLKALSARLAQVTGDLTIQKQRLSATTDTHCRDSLGALIGFLKGQVKDLELQIAALIKADEDWSLVETTVRSVKGLGDRTVGRICAELPEIGRISNRAISKLVGLAPLANDSGKAQKKRAIRGGRPGLRSLLFLVADIARKFDPDLAAFRQRLLDKGKAKMAVRIALAHKLLVRLNAKVRDARAESAPPA